MILSRLVTFFRIQDWGGFAVEMALIIAGVLIALQVDNWNDGRVAEAKFRQQLALLNGEMAENEVRIGDYIASADEVMAGLVELRVLLHAADERIDPAALADALFWLLPVPTSDPRKDVLDRGSRSLWR